jgi:hypothetical protein
MASVGNSLSAETLRALIDGAKVARENAVLGHYDTALLNYDVILGLVQQYNFFWKITSTDN